VSITRGGDTAGVCGEVCMSESSAVCKEFPTFARAQLEHLRRCIDEHKWYRSEEVGHDVGLAYAEADFMDRHIERVAKEFRAEFCGERCVCREQCSVTDIIAELNRRWKSGDLPMPPTVTERTSRVG